mmetsp:Transcript_84452/g.239545  ORF Transcript_84452/g.239545 Transcript_84452/m.239545 type:complete len:251 (-) Transcript_84452:1372-2124(-)
MSARAASSRRTASAWPPSAAQWRGRSPMLSSMSGSIFASRSALRALREEHPAATCRADSPRPPFRLRAFRRRERPLTRDATVSTSSTAAAWSSMGPAHQSLFLAVKRSKLSSTPSQPESVLKNRSIFLVSSGSLHSAFLQSTASNDLAMSGWKYPCTQDPVGKGLLQAKTAVLVPMNRFFPCLAANSMLYSGHPLIMLLASWLRTLRKLWHSCSALLTWSCRSERVVLWKSAERTSKKKSAESGRCIASM